MTTEEAARKAGVTARQLRDWQRDGWLTPSSNGRMDNGRRIEWSDADVAKAVALKSGDSTKSPSEAVLDSLGGKAFTDSLGRALAAQERLSRDQVVLAGPSGTRVVSRLSMIENALTFVGSPAVILARVTRS